MKKPEGNWQAWLRKAEHDRLAIHSILEADKIPWDVVCFHCQQAAEKLMKGLLVYHGIQPTRTHDLVALLHECKSHDPGPTADHLCSEV